MSGEHIEMARRLRPIVEKAMSGETTTNKEAFEALMMMPDQERSDFWDGHLIYTSTRIRWGTRLLAAMNDLWAYPENNPGNAPTLWEEIAYLDGCRVLYGPISASNPVEPGEMCWEDGKLYRCIYHVACTYRPSEYAAAWEEVAAE